MGSVQAMRDNLLVVPLLADSSFRFPVQEFWHNLEAGKVLSTQDSPLLDGVSLVEIVTAYKSVFKVIAVNFTEHGSETIQMAEISELAKRLRITNLQRSDSMGLATMS